MVPVAPIITGITFVFTFHMRCISIVRSLYFRIFYYYYYYYYNKNRNTVNPVVALCIAYKGRFVLTSKAYCLQSNTSNAQFMNAYLVFVPAVL